MMTKFLLRPFHEFEFKVKMGERRASINYSRANTITRIAKRAREELEMTMTNDF
jgi:hypothetical protein